MGDIVGRLFREFAITLSVTILVSAVVSLTLTPMMCAKLLQHKTEAEQGRFYRLSEQRLRPVIDVLRQDAAMGSAASDRDAAGRGARRWCYRAALRLSSRRDFSRCRTPA